MVDRSIRFFDKWPRNWKLSHEDMTGVVAGKISRMDVADLMIKQLTEPTCFKKTVLLAY